MNCMASPASSRWRQQNNQRVLISDNVATLHVKIDKLNDILVGFAL
jgi:hypothetical protein